MILTIPVMVPSPLRFGARWGPLSVASLQGEHPSLVSSLRCGSSRPGRTMCCRRVRPDSELWRRILWVGRSTTRLCEGGVKHMLGDFTGSMHLCLRACMCTASNQGHARVVRAVRNDPTRVRCAQHGTHTHTHTNRTSVREVAKRSYDQFVVHLQFDVVAWAEALTGVVFQGLLPHLLPAPAVQRSPCLKPSATFSGARERRGFARSARTHGTARSARALQAKKSTTRCLQLL